MERKLTTIRRIVEIRPIENADAIEAARVDGWWCVVKKGEFEINDEVLYIEVDAWIPTEIAPFLTKPGKTPKEFNGVRGERLRTVRLRKQLSQGLLLDPNTFPQFSQLGLYEHIDYSDILGIQLWERPIPAELKGQIRGIFPNFIRKTDQERIQNIPEVLDDRDTEYEVTIKFDGSSITVYAVDGRPGVCSRNLDLKLSAENNNNRFVKTARETGLLEAVLCFQEETDRSIAVQAELMGPGIQGNRENFCEHKLLVFDIWDIDEQKYLLPNEKYWVLSQLINKFGAHVTHAKIVAFRAQLSTTSMEDMLGSVEQEGQLHSELAQPIEGLVFKATNGNRSFKIINNAFLESEK